MSIIKMAGEPGFPEPQPCAARMAQRRNRHHMCAERTGTAGNRRRRAVNAHPFGRLILVLVATPPDSGNRNCAWHHPRRKSPVCGSFGRACDGPDTGTFPSIQFHKDKLDPCRTTDHEGANMPVHVTACIRCRRVFHFLSVGRMLLSQRLGSPRLVISHRYGCRHAERQAFVNHKAPQLASGPLPRSADRRDRMPIGSVWRHRADSFWKADTA
ncbi:hypothetical protein [Azospirillum palustre]